jgi:glycosyltransferase involved in cell wall biosynthesis
MTSPQANLAVSDRPRRAVVAGHRSLTRLLIIATDAPFADAHHLSLACAARRAGYEVHVAAPLGPGDRSVSEKTGLHLHALPAKPEHAGSSSGYAMLRALARLIGALRPALVHCIGLSAVLYGGAIARARGIAAVHASTDLVSALLDEGRRTRFDRIVLQHTLAFACRNRRAYITVGSVDERTVLARLGVIDSERALLLHGVGADLKLFHPRDSGEPEREGPLVVMHAAPLTAANGARDFVALARRLRAKGAPLRFVLAGARDSAKPGSIPEGEISRWLAEGAVEWWSDSQDMAAVLRQADIFCVPVPRDTGTPQVLIEAVASGLPVVAVDSAGCRKIVRHGRNGLLVPAQNADAMDAALLRFAGDMEFRRAASGRSREIAVAEFSLDTVLTAALAVYRVTLGRPLVEAPR